MSYDGSVGDNFLRSLPPINHRIVPSQTPAGAVFCMDSTCNIAGEHDHCVEAFSEKHHRNLGYRFLFYHCAP